MNDKFVDKQSFTLPAMNVGETRYFMFKFVEGSISNLKISPQKLELTVWASFNNLYPSEANYDFKTECKPGKECHLMVKDPSSFLNDVCKANNITCPSMYDHFCLCMILRTGSKKKMLTIYPIIQIILLKSKNLFCKT